MLQRSSNLYCNTVVCLHYEDLLRFYAKDNCSFGKKSYICKDKMRLIMNGLNDKFTICACASRTFMKDSKIIKLAAAIHAAGADVEIVDDLCELCEEKSERVKDIAQTIIVACHERAVKSLMAFAGEDIIRCVDLRSGESEDILQDLDISAETAVDSSFADSIKTILGSLHRKQGRDAWYPALDKSACAECGKCLEFCPFGVYKMVDDRVTVVNPHNCKNNCPACARTCPSGAIIFAKYDKSPINGGVDMQEATASVGSKEMFNQALRERLAHRRESVKLKK